MPKSKMYKKKLTNSGSGARVLAFFAMLFSAVGCGLEPLCKFIYSATHNGKTLGNLFSDKFSDYLGNSLLSCSVFLVSLVIFCGLAGSAKKMKMDTFSITLSIFSGIALIISPVYEIVKHLMDNNFAGLVGKDYIITCKLISYSLPALSAFLIILSGLALAGKITDDYIEVDIPLKKDLILQNSMSNNNASQMNQPVGSEQSAFVADNVNNRIYAEPVVSNVTNAADTINENTDSVNPAGIITDEKEEKSAENSVEAFAEMPTEKAENSDIADNSQTSNNTEEITDSDNKENLKSDVQPGICRKCLSPLKTGAKFCSVCGTKIDE